MLFKLWLEEHVAPLLEKFRWMKGGVRRPGFRYRVALGSYLHYVGTAHGDSPDEDSLITFLI